jgi:hypothetical protein
MKKTILSLFAILILTAKIQSQSFLNGSFEINTATCQGYISNAVFNSVMTNVKAIGNLQMISIYDTNLVCGYVEDGNFAINLIAMSSSSIDAVSLKLTDSVHAGHFYSVSFYQHYISLVNSDSIAIGISDNDSTFGTLAGIAPWLAIPDVWLHRVVNFIAPTTGNYITVKPIYVPLGFNTLDNFTLDTIPLGINNLSPEYNFQLFPNPTNSTLNLIQKNKGEIIITNTLGEIVLQKTVEGKVELDVSFLSSGIYFIKAGNEMRKFVKE